MKRESRMEDAKSSSSRWWGGDGCVVHEEDWKQWAQRWLLNCVLMSNGYNNGHKECHLFVFCTICNVCKEYETFGDMQNSQCALGTVDMQNS